MSDLKGGAIAPPPVREMGAGRDLDERVAREVFGLRTDSSNGQCFCCDDAGGTRVAPMYSGHAAAMLDVVTAMKQRGYTFALWCEGGGFKAAFRSGDDWPPLWEPDGHLRRAVRGTSAPHATALAALHALEARDG